MNSPPENGLGTHVMLRLDDSRWSSGLERRLQALQPGGILLTGPLPDSPENIHELLSRTATCLRSPPILALQADPDGRSFGAMLPPLPSARWLAQKGTRILRQAGDLLGHTLALLGFNSYWGPNLDLASRPGEDSACSFSDNPSLVAECGAAFLHGLSRQNVLACGKHFPGLGSFQSLGTNKMPVCGRSMAELWRSDLLPFRDLLPQLPALLMSTAAYKAYDFDYPRPALLSSQIVQGLLRDKLGYRGVVVAPQMAWASTCGTLDPSAAALCLAAGCDMLVTDEAGSSQSRRSIEDALSSCEVLAAQRIDSLARIHAMKCGLSRPESFRKGDWERVSRRWEQFRVS